MTAPLLTYLRQMHATRGRVVAEAGLYPTLQNFLNDISAAAKASVRVMVHPRNQGAGIPDFAILDEKQDEATMPNHGVIEAKAYDHNLDELASSDQVKKYLEKYGQVLVTNYYQFALVTLREAKAQIEERYDLAPNAEAFWQAAPQALVKQHAVPLQEFVLRVYRRSTPLSSPQEVAWWLASYARQAKARLEGLEQSDYLRQLQADLEAALEIRFSGADGDHFFRSTLVQTLFYGLFAAWVLWHERGGKGDFDLWRDTRKITIPVINQLFHQFTDPQGLEKLGLGDYLEATVKTLNRVERPAFFAKFETENAIQYFYEPFLEAFDPELRKTLGVWYTPPEIVRYMVRRVDQVLQTELGIEEGLASRDVVVLDPCCGTGAYLLEAMQLIYEGVKQDKGARRAADIVRDATQERIYGFEIMPAPFVVAHLQVGLRLARWGAQAQAGKRSGIYLTNALTDWDDAKPRTIRLPGLKEEQDSAREVKQSRKDSSL